MNISSVIRLIQELRRREVFRVAVVYGATAFLILQVVALVVEPLMLPEWTMTLLIILIAAGFPVALVLAWAFELTPEGLKLTPSAAAAPQDPEATEQPAPRRSRLVPAIAAAVLVIGGGWWGFQAWRSGPEGVPTTPSVGVAVLANQTGNPRLDWSREGVARLIIDNLAQSRFLQVATAERMAILSASATNEQGLVDVAKAAGIDYLLTGEILPAGERFSLVMRLLDTRQGKQVATGRRDNLTVEDLLAASDHMALMVRRSLGVPLAELADSYIADFAAANPEAYESYIDGLNAFVRYRYAVAEVAFAQALEQAPDFTMARYRLAHVLAAQGRTDRAQALIAQAAAETPRLSDRDARYVLAVQALIERRNEDAIRKFREIIELYPYETEARRQLAELYTSLRMADKAVEVAQELRRLAPESPTTWSLLGRSHLSRNDYTQAVQALQRFVELAPQEANARHLLATSYRAQGELALAVSEYRAALQLNPDFHFSTEAMAITEALRGRLDAAASLLAPLVSDLNVLPRYRIDAAFALAHVRRAQGRFMDAALVLAALEQLLADEWVREAMAYAVRGSSLMEIGDLRSARSLIERSIESSPGAPTRYLFARGLLELREGDVAAARGTAAEIVTHALPSDDPDRTEDKAAAYLRGLALIEEGSSERAIREFSAAVALSGYEYQVYRLGLARAYLAAGRIEEAAAAAREAMVVTDLADPRIDFELDRRRAQLLLAEVEQAMGRGQQASDRASELLQSWSGADASFRDLARARELVGESEMDQPLSR